MPVRVLLIVVALMAGGCVSVPLATIARMSSFDEADFAALDPAALRVKVTLPAGFGLDAGRSWLGVEVKSGDRSHYAAFELDQESVQVASIRGGLFAPATVGGAHVLALRAASRTRFAELQKFVGQGPADEISIRVVPVLSSAPPGATEVKVWIDLRLSAQEGYFTLLDAASIELAKLRPAGPG